MTTAATCATIEYVDAQDSAIVQEVSRHFIAANTEAVKRHASVKEDFRVLGDDLDKLGKRLGKRIGRLESNMASVKETLDQHDKRFDAHDKRFDTLEGKMDRVLEILEGKR